MGKHLREKPTDWSEIVGMPDDWDKKNLQTLIKNFASEKFSVNGKTFTGKQWIEYEVKDAKKSHQQEHSPFNEYGVKIKDTDTRIGTAIPNVLWDRIQESYPTMFRDKKHFDWFVVNFPMFRVAGKW